ncbi:MAG TPA: ATP-grasp domain-containing protein [Longimicrobiales bacterium]|nr:ATP-grasp domain-containing protein [Longimicrobiales bacterium]
MPRILLTDGEARSALAVVRSLGRAGHDVAVCSATGRSLAGASRHCRADLRVPDPAASLERFADAVARIVDERGIEVVIPVTDRTTGVVPLLRARDAPPVVAFPDYDTYLRASDKRGLLEAAAALGVPVPAQVVLERPPADAAESADRLAPAGFPVVLKPARSAVQHGGRVTSFGVSFAESAGELARRLAEIPEAAYPLLIQERIAGTGAGVFVLARGGRVVASFAHRRIREKPPTGGVSVYRESVAVPPALAAHARRIMEHYCWTGVAMIEFKLEHGTGVPYLMEVNGRFWGSLQLAIDAGVDFPRLLVDAALGCELPQIDDYQLGRRSRWLWGDVDHLLWILRTPRAARASHPGLPGRLGALARFLVPWRPGDRLEVLRLDDPRPFFRETVQWFRALRA